MEKYRNLFVSGYLNIWHEEFLLGMEASLGKCLMRKTWPGRSGSAVPRWQRGEQLLEVNRGGKKEKGSGESKKGQKLAPELWKPPRRCVWFRSTCAYTARSLLPKLTRVWAFFGGNYENGLDSPSGWTGCGIEATWAGWGGGLYAELSESRRWKLVWIREWNYPLPQISRILVRATRVAIAFSDIFFQTEQIWRPHQLLTQRDIPRQKKHQSSPITLGTGVVGQMCARPNPK